MTGPTAVKALTIKAKSRPPLIVILEGVEYEVPGRVPPEILTIQADYKIPRNQSKEIQERYQQELGIAMINKFYELVLPESLKSVLDMENLSEVFEGWFEHVGLGESKDSGN